MITGMARSALVTGRLRRAVRRVTAVLLLATVSTVAPLTALAGPPPSGRWVQPVAGAEVHVVRGFEPPEQRWLPGHRGVDLAASAGSTVRAAGDGVVTHAGAVAGRGVVVVSHGDLRTTYEPVAAVVSTGGRVEAGQTIGTLGAAVGSHCAPQACLHWGLLHGDTYLDPFGLLRGRAVRLLPLGSAAIRPQVAADVHPDLAGAWSARLSGPTSTVGLVLAAAAAAGLR
jgi:murein DD-endopeptidase MepM/ murein hydrolase activator NlpD